MKKFTKIVATLGPASDDIKTIRQLYNAGMNVARLNFSHGSYEYFEKIIKNIREVSDDIAILLDTKGPEIRTGVIADDIVILDDNQELIFTKEEIEGDSHKVYINYDKLEKLEVGNKILIDDGLIETEVLSVDGVEVKVKVLNGGKLGSRKTVSVWGHNVEIPFLSTKDKEDIEFGVKQGLDFIAASFVRTQGEVLELRKFLKKLNSNMRVISKIEHSVSVENIEGIITSSFGIMVARGDLAVEIPMEKVPRVQVEIIRRCRELGKPVIVATQMLESMKDNPRPTRAEVSDVAQAIVQGTDAVMLSGETAGGKYPLKAVEMMATIAKEYDFVNHEEVLDNFSEEDYDKNSISIFITKSAYMASKTIKAKTILIPTVTGYSARKVSRFRPSIPILAIAHDKTVQRQLQLSWGVKAVFVKEYYENKADMLKILANQVEKSKYVKKDTDRVIIASGHILNKSGHTNHLEVYELKNMK